MKHIFEVATGFGLCGVATIVEHFDVGEVEERVLLVVNSVPAPETAVPVHLVAEYEPLVARFGRVVHLNDLIRPEHPFGWSPVADSHHARLAAAQLRSECGVGDGEPHTLWLESIQGVASHSLARTMDTAEVNIYSDGLMTYGPTRIDLSPRIGDRVRGVYHLDLAPGHTPYVLREFGPRYHPFPVESFLRTTKLLHAAPIEHEVEPVSIVLGQYLADLELLTPEQDAALLERMIAVALEAEPGLPVLVRPHPRAARDDVHRVVQGFSDAGAAVRLAPPAGLVETLYQELDVRLVVSCFSTGMFTARALGIRTIAVGAREVLAALEPYQNSNRVAVVMADLLNESAALEGGGIRGREPDQETIELVIAMTSISMQPGVLEALVGVHDERLAALPAERRDVVRRYIPQHHLARVAPSFGPVPVGPTQWLGRRLRRSRAARGLWRRARAAWVGARAAG